MQNDKGKGSPSVVIVDHDNIFVQLITSMLQQHGWTVSDFTSPAAAAHALDGGTLRPGLLIAGLDRPGSPMRKLVEQARRRHPELPCLLVAGDRKILPMILPGNTRFIHKPVRPSQLLLIAEEMFRPVESGPA